MNRRPLRHGRIVKDLGAKALVSFTYSATQWIEDEVTITLPIRKENVEVNPYGIVTVTEQVYEKIMNHINGNK